MARSRSITGPYELHPDTYILSSRNRPDAPLQRAGHASLVHAADGTPWIAYLCGRPLPNRGRCVLGRETAIQPMRWDDNGWLYTLACDAMPIGSIEHSAPAPGPAQHRYTFNQPTLPIDFQWLRTPQPEQIFSLTARSGYLRLFGRETLGSLFTQALVARRQQAFCYSASTRIEVEPAHFQQAAGLICYYNAAKFHYLHITHDEQHGRHVRVMSALPDSPQADAFTAPIPIAPGAIELGVDVDFEWLRFRYGADGDATWRWLPEQFDASILSDEAATPRTPNFTGAFVGVACQDMAGTAIPADIAWFEYRERDYRPTPGA